MSAGRRHRSASTTSAGRQCRSASGHCAGLPARCSPVAMPVGRFASVRRSAIAVGRHDFRRTATPVGRHANISRSAIPVGRHDVRRSAIPVGRHDIRQSTTPVGRHDIRRSAMPVGQHDIRRSATSVTDCLVGTVGTDYLRAAGLVCSRVRTRPESHAAKLVGCRLEECSFEPGVLLGGREGALLHVHEGSVLPGLILRGREVHSFTSTTRSEDAPSLSVASAFRGNGPSPPAPRPRSTKARSCVVLLNACHTVILTDYASTSDGASGTAGAIASRSPASRGSSAPPRRSRRRSRCLAVEGGLAGSAGPTRCGGGAVWCTAAVFAVSPSSS